ncbi:glycine cleavage system aminomethyltransferase GcvT [Pseudomonadales bacterium]|nr:glycine cleavage system aminomethyltransferase GcvT [Pseudomonadales bacterium]
MSNMTVDPAQTALYSLHVDAGARMVPFAGYAMPVQYVGIKAEHLHTRSQVGLFDVSHMGQVLVSGENAAAELERLLPVDLEALEVDGLCYTFFTNPVGGILDDLIVVRRSPVDFMLVVNAGCKHDDIAHLKKHLSADVDVDYFEEQSLLALQGPSAEAVLVAVLADIAEQVAQLGFMQGLSVQLAFDDNLVDMYISRSGYTGEDGFEISLPNDFATLFASELLLQSEVEWVGLGARDSLRLEAGLCLYGHDLNVETTPVEAGLSWSIDKKRRAGGSKAGGFPGAAIIFEQMNTGPNKKRAGFTVDGRVPVREGAEVVNQHGGRVGHVTSGGFAPSLDGSIVMAYIETAALSNQDTEYYAVVRGKKQALSRCGMPFIAHNYKRIRD